MNDIGWRMGVLVVCAFVHPAMLGAHAQPPEEESAMQTITYRGIRPDDPGGRDGLRNPERGLRIETLIAELPGAPAWGPSGHLKTRLTPGYSDQWWVLDAERYAAFGLTLAQTYCYLDAFMDTPIGEEKLAVLERSLATLRRRGFKALLRFAYEKTTNQAEGPTRDVILAHMDQLAPIVRRNVDVIFVLQAGFVGAWGEWHSSAHKLEKDHDALAAIVAKLLDVLPASRMTQVRVPKYKRWVLGDQPLDQYAFLDGSTAYSGSPLARIGFHNDGFLAHQSCGGTWPEAPHFSNPGNPEFDYMTTESPYVPVDGELFWSDQGGKVEGLRAAARMRLHHYTSFSIAHSYSEREGAPLSMDDWMKTPLTVEQVRQAALPIADGYFEDAAGNTAARTQFEYLRDHLGYRIELQSAEFPRQIDRGGTLDAEVALINRGFSTFHNARPVYLVLIDDDRCVAEIAVTDADPRTWQPFAPGDGEYKPLVHTIRVSWTPPDGLEPKGYLLGLWLPDAAEAIRMDPRYAVRVANGGIPWWTDASGGYGANILGPIRVTK